ncbi:sulfate/molybdate ABC transporter ATP-binding protein [Ancylobacter mangrovi]|uniref:Sulfate/molybdate ABC transporter ATP-binding protein n=1 Tax=Ancylobacter mangrovi TaxID=2972472 RepID=A0A9X2PCV1_9HYPH|nr:sulfate/molybdate ABC transporter ATP-binding protein [Ancylobacter mangrovi]MCS0496394.1 sulfate/molybdate ABC transporter ATP-binding protein [Ancylobacter mangrovi]MCS0504405.1 sulfate/molybdate ABC transporter ATP-binding protein [Ancylobacter mangrovi]
MTVAVTIEEVGKSFGSGTPALAGISLDVAPGELVALLGPSGSGKTTLLRIVAGLEQPSTGRVLFNGEDALSVPVRRRGIGFVFQNYALFRHMTVAENVAFGLRSRPRAQRPPEAEIKGRVADLLALVQLEAFGGRFPAQLSGGQRQRVALARALAIEPRVLLLDEPFGALDALVRKELRRWLRELHDRTGHTTLFVTHDQEEALELADRVVVMGRGRIEQVGTPDDVYDRPATAAVFGFMGESSRIEVDVREGVAVAGSTAIAAATQPVPDGPGLLYVRPHDISLGLPGTPGLRGEVRAFRRHGAIRRVEVEVGNALFEADIAPTVRVPIGEKVAVRLDRARLFASGGPGVDCRPPPPQQPGDYAI